MGTSSKWRFALATVALLLDLTAADIMIQPGYGKAGSGRNSLGNSQSTKHEPMVQQPQQQQQDQMQQYSSSQNPTLQFLQHQHALQRNYLQQKHQEQHQQLLGLQQQELQHAATQSSQGPSPGNEVVGHMWGAPGLIHGAGGLHGGNLFSLSPLGLNSFTLPGLGGFGHPFPMLLATHQNPQMTETESSQPDKSVDEPKTRERREIRDSGESKRYRQRQSRPHENGVENPTVKSKSDAPQSTKSSKSSGDIVGDVHQEANNDENVGSPGGLLDPLGLMDKAESMIDDLRTGHLPNPMEILNRGGGGGGGGGGGLLPGLPNWLNAANPMTNQNSNEPMVSQPQQYNPYQMQQANDQYSMMNQQRSQSQQPSGPMVGDSRHILPQPMVPRPAMYGSYAPYGAARYGAYGSPYRMYVQPYSAMGPWARHSNLMNYQGSPIIGAANPAAQDTVGNPISGDNAQPGTEKAGAQGKSSPMNGMNDGPVVGAQNPTVGGPNPGQFQPFPRAMSYPGTYYQMMPTQNQMAGYYQLARNAQQAMGTNPMTGSPGPVKTIAAAPQNPQMVGAPNPMGGKMNEFYDPNLQNNYYNDNGQFGYNDFNGDLQRHRRPGYDLDDIFDTGYGHGGIHSGSFDRIYETTTVHGHPYGYGGGIIPHHTHGHQSSYII